MTKIGREAFGGGDIFDGETLHKRSVLLVENGRVIGICAEDQRPENAEFTDLGEAGEGMLIAPGLVDLQVNGGGGVMFNDHPNAEGLEAISAALAGLGTTSFLPTLITDGREKMGRAIDACEVAAARDLGALGLHLEGPFIAKAKKGAHPARFVRTPDDADLDMLKRAAGQLPLLKMTLAPEITGAGFIRKLTDAGILVSLGHSEASFDCAMEAANAGARMVTHLFNAMSQLQAREPGLVGAALASPDLAAGIIVDFVHVHEANIALAMKAKAGDERLFLVSDCMGVAGSSLEECQLDGRLIRRENGRLAYEDGTLAGADLDLLSAVRNLVTGLEVEPLLALAMASRIPARLIGEAGRDIGHLQAGARADFILLTRDFDLKGVWRGGQGVKLAEAGARG